MKFLKENSGIVTIILIIIALIVAYNIWAKKTGKALFSGNDILPGKYIIEVPKDVRDMVSELGFNTIMKNGREAEFNKLPEMLVLKDNLSRFNKKQIWPMKITKVTDGPIELPLKQSLIEKGYKYEFIDVNPGETINITAIKDYPYEIDGKAFFDTFLVTDKNYLIAYSAAAENFGIEKQKV